MTNSLANIRPAPKLFLLTLSFLVSYGIYLALPGPTYQAFFLVLLIALSYYWIKDLPTALFQVFLFVFFFEKPLFYLPDFLVQLKYPFQATELYQFFAEIPLRFIIFIPFAFSVLFNHLSQPVILTTLPIVKKSLLLFVGSGFLLIANQFFAPYPAQYNWQFWHLLFIIFSVPIFYLFFSLKQDLKSYRILLLSSFVFSSLLLQSALTTLQFIKQNRLNLVIENSSPDPRTLLTDEDSRFRTPGTFSAPNYLAANIGMLLLYATTFMIMAPVAPPKFRKIVALSIVGGLFSLTTNLSRWAWLLTLILALLIFFQSPLTRQKKLLVKWLTKHKAYALLPSLAIILFMLPRFFTVTTLTPRIEIAQATLKVIIQNPLFGVGPGQNGIGLMHYYQSQQKFLDSLQGPHNTLAYVALENGLPLTLILFSGVALILFRVKKRSPHWHYYGLWYSSLFFICASMAYPLYLFDSSLLLFFLFLALLLQLHSETKDQKINNGY